MHAHCFNQANVEKLRDPERWETQNPHVLWDLLVQGLDPRAVVDLGTEVGFYALPFARRLGPRGLVYACDNVPRMLDFVREALRHEGVPNVEPVLTDAVRVPLATGVADAAAMIDVHHHLADPVANLAEVWRLLRPGGRVLLMDWAPRVTPHGPPLRMRIPAERLALDLERAGFRGVVQHDRLPYHTVLTAQAPR